METQVKAKRLYQYEGAVRIFGQVVAHDFKAQTWATSQAKARNNIAWQFKKKGNVAGHIPVTLTGEIKESL